MKREELIELFKKPESAKAYSPEELRELVNKYPYCQPLRLIYCRNLYDNDHIDLKAELLYTSTRIPDRKKLYEILQRPPIEIEEEIDLSDAKEEGHPTQVEETPAKTSTTSKPEQKGKREAPSEKPQSTTTEEDPSQEVDPGPLEREILNHAIDQKVKRDTEESLIEEIQAKPPLDEDQREESADKEERDEPEPKTRPTQKSKRSFTDWLAPSSPEGGKEEEKENKEKLLERFIQEEPSISPRRAEFFSSSEMARKSTEEDESLVTETLARIYEQQGNLNKAIKAYQQLRLKYPEKSSYFADRIQKIKENQ